MKRKIIFLLMGLIIVATYGAFNLISDDNAMSTYQNVLSAEQGTHELTEEDHWFIGYSF
jgi:hypothetical protein